MKFVCLALLCLITACADSESYALEQDREAPVIVRDYADAAAFLANKSGIIAVCRAALEIEGDRELGYRQEHCKRVLEQSAQIKEATLLWMSASKAEQDNWFIKNPYEFREMLNAIKDYDVIVNSLPEAGL